MIGLVGDELGALQPHLFADAGFCGVYGDTAKYFRLPLCNSGSIFVCL